jgi:hypothetical protein
VDAVLWIRDADALLVEDGGTVAFIAPLLPPLPSNKLTCCGGEGWGMDGGVTLLPLDDGVRWKVLGGETLLSLPGFTDGFLRRLF